MSRVLLACGGTGGHLAPGIALAEKLHARGVETLLLVSRKTVDSRMLARYPHLQFRAGRGRGFGPSLLDRILFLPSMVWALLDALWVVLSFRPNALACFGGFMSVGPAVACWLARVPVHLHEANMRAGKAIRWLAPLATSVHAPPATGLRSKYLRSGGFPLRAEIQPLSIDQARGELHFPTSGKLILVVGGSQGANALTRWVEVSAPALAKLGCHVLCLTGPNGSERSEQYGEAVIRYVPFCDRMAAAYSAADIAVSRAGAGTLAELAACRTPAILVPYPRAADDHQTANARAREVVGASLLCPESELAGLLPIIERLIAQPQLLTQMREALVREHLLNRWDDLVDDIVLGVRREASL